MMGKNLVSIIVPVYKVEKELVRCLKSILKQTYKNIEILLIDDGSPDKCPDICDYYAKKDKRIKVFHKENGGLSSARNYGLDKTNGKYISFIDSDDWVDKDFIKVMVSNLEKEKADISIIGYKMTWDNGKIIKSNYENEYEVYNFNSAIHELMAQKKFQCMVCTKLYKAELFDDIRFPDGMLFEDVAVGLPLFKKCKKIVFSGQAKYYYYQRNDSIVNSTFDYRKMIMLNYCQNMIDFSEQSGGIYDKEAYAFYLKAALMLILNAYSSLDTQDAKKAKKILTQKIKKYKKHILFNPYIEKRRQIVLLAIIIDFSPKFLNKLWKLKIKCKTKI